jgi:hypothetical protein
VTADLGIADAHRVTQIIQAASLGRNRYDEAMNTARTKLTKVMTARGAFSRRNM